MMPFKVIAPLFRANTEQGVRTYINQGGTSSGKTYTIMQVLIYFALVDAGCVITVVGQDLPNLKVGALRDTKTIIGGSEWLLKFFKFNESGHFAVGRNGSVIEFKSYKDEQDAKNGKRDYLFLNEANGIGYDVYWQLSIRTRKKIYIDYNPSERFWVHNEVKGSEGTSFIISDHRGNPFLSEEEHARIEAISDRELWKVYARGLTGKLSGVIFPNFNIVDDLPPRDSWKLHGYGLDFGFTNDPTALTHNVIAHGELWTDLLIYETGLTNPMIAEKAKELGITRADQIIADSAEPKSIKEIYNAGLWIIPTVKGSDSIGVGIDILRRYKWNVTRRSFGLIEELQAYKWKKDRDGKETNTPIDAFNHAIDATRYFALMKLNVKKRGRAKAHYNRLD
ncbi:MAG: terminase large subunit [Prevotellaceae bacterium]|nr:terminase large subunit [Prevotella sp.]MDD7272821.1 terminase large subunit [Prevotellaceae bacterium]